jgi:ADP-ribosylglycohydrolase
MDCAEFFAGVSWLVLKGKSPVSAMEEVSGGSFKGSPISKWVEEGIKSKEEESVPVIIRLGQSCHAGEAFPGVVHLIARYEDNLEEALVQSVMAGGDSAARGMLVGMVLGAYLGDESIPEAWLSGLKRSNEILSLLDRIQ